MKSMKILTILSNATESRRSTNAYIVNFKCNQRTKLILC